MRKSKGFTLIELLIVVAILGILGSILFVSISGDPQRRTRDAKRIGDLAGLRLAVEMYFNDPAYGRYPPDLNALVTAGFLGALPEDPLPARTTPCSASNLNGDYSYGVDTNGTTYFIVACLEGNAPPGSSRKNYTATTPTLNCNADPKLYCVGN